MPFLVMVEQEKQQSAYSKGLVFAVVSAFFSSVATILFSASLKVLHPLFGIGLSYLVGSIFVFSIILLKKEKIDFAKLRESRKDFALLTIIRGLVGSVFFTYGLSLTTGIKAIFFTKAEPYFVMFWNWVMHKEKVSAKHLVLLTIHIIGAIILSTGGIFELGRAQLGDLLIIIAMGFFALSYVYGKRVSDNIGSKATNALMSGIVGLILLPISLLLLPGAIPSLSQETTAWTYFLFYLLFWNVISLTLWFSSLKTVKGWMVSALRALGPLMGAPFAFFLLGETLTPIQLAGGVVVLATSFLIAREHVKGESQKIPLNSKK
jgi:drug/metabolite transporter (DMT)-like permease